MISVHRRSSAIGKVSSQLAVSTTLPLPLPADASVNKAHTTAFRNSGWNMCLFPSLLEPRRRVDQAHNRGPLKRPAAAVQVRHGGVLRAAAVQGRRLEVLELAVPSEICAERGPTTYHAHAASEGFADMDECPAGGLCALIDALFMELLTLAQPSAHCESPRRS